MSVSCECSVLAGRGLRRADHSSREVLPTVLRRYVWLKTLMNEEAMARVGPQRHKNNAASTAKITKYLMKSGDDHNG